MIDVSGLDPDTCQHLSTAIRVRQLMGEDWQNELRNISYNNGSQISSVQSQHTTEHLSRVIRLTSSTHLGG